MAKFKFPLKIDDCDSDGDIIGMRQALPIEPIPEDFDPSIAPTTGEQYLQHVLYEAKKLPSLFSAKRRVWESHDTPCESKLLGVKPGIERSLLAPCPTWESEQVHKFDSVRNAVHKQRLKKWHNESQLPDVDANEPEWFKFLKTNKPLVSVIFGFRQEELERALHMLCKLMTPTHFDLELGAWVYAVAACLEHPLSREACGDLRDIARKCAEIRQHKTNAEDRELVAANLIITLVVRYFGQIDLLDSS